jgi:hypothetical protein
MNLTTTQRLSRLPGKLFSNMQRRSEGIYTLIIVFALLAFEIFNFSTTEYALHDMLGDLGMGAVRWSMILSLAFSGMDFAGIARLLTFSKSDGRHDREDWYLLGAWVLAAAMNAGLTWWGISVAIYNQPADSVFLLDPMTFVTVIPVLVALMVWVIRILIIGMLVSSLTPLKNISSGKQSNSYRQPMGFRDGRQAVPAGFKPIPDQTRAQNERSFF